MEAEKRLPFGKRIKCGSFLVTKFVKTLGKAELKTLRDEAGIPKEFRKHLERGGLPYIKVEALSGIWSVSYCCNTQMYHVIDLTLQKAIDDEAAGAEDSGFADMAGMFLIMMTDTMVFGDVEYQQAKARAMKEMLERQKAPEISKEDDDKILDDLKRDEEAKATIVEMMDEAQKMEE